MTRFKYLLAGLMLLCGISGASAQNCTGQAIAGAVCGNPNASTGIPFWATQTALLDRGFGSTQGTILNRGASVWSAVSTPSLGRNGGTSGSLSFFGQTSGFATIGVKAVAGTTTFNLPVGNGAPNQVLITDGAGNTSWTNAGAGTVSSVGLSMPGIFTVTGSPVTGAGTLTATLNTQTANTVWAGPTTGAAASPAFRALVGADLPNPSASSLGGIQSAAAVTHQWVNSISTSGVPALSQPSFADISGAITPAQCPNPTASTTGCVQSYAAVPNQWINAVSTSGVHSSTQPTFADLAGQATLPQLPSIGNNTIISNITGVTSTPAANSFTSIIDATTGSAQGSILYRSGTVWTALSPGTSGQVLTTSGASANPSWTSVTGTGTVTSVACGTGLSGGTFTTSGTCALAPIASGNVLGNVTGGSAAPVATTPTQVLDVIGSTQGNILYRSGTVWSALAPGTNGQVLMTPGAGSTPSWANTVSSVATGAGLAGGTITTTGTVTLGTVPPGGRLTTISGVCIPTTDVVAATTLYYAPCVNPYVPIYDGTNVLARNFTSGPTDAVGLSLVLGSNWASGTLYDVFVTMNAGSPTLCTVAWSSSGTGSSTRATNLAPYAGLPTNATTATCRNTNSTTLTVAANQGTWLGTVFIATGGGAIDIRFGTTANGGGWAIAGIWNAYNRTNGSFFVVDSNTSFTPTSANAYLPYDSGNTGGGQLNRVYLVSGDGSGQILASMNSVIGNIASTTITYVGVGLNVTNAMWPRCATAQAGLFGGSTSQIPVSATCSGYAPIGLNYLQAMIFSQSTSTAFYGGTSPPISGLSVTWSW